ncbi:hypothetical protein ATL39_0837 [Sinobaca qinghaiensis]|uniref:Uncharacterized protein n=1 Tax=Sinobaca qinghaiensis TaxID=342944 RepID=A0A419V5M7_9BACL|nr:DUF5345 family protein [Sinobaca qinghaiensis]RKD75141.1 hypothetical protein ATL39_0837 [Sinobaca qinghaiensis]
MKDNEVKERLKQSLSVMEESSPGDKPTLNEMVTQVKQTRQKQKKELYIFFIIALIFITGIILFIASEPLVFIVFQAAATILGIGFLIVERRLQHE